MFLSKSKTIILFENKKFKAIKVSFKAGKLFVEKKLKRILPQKIWLIS